MDNYMKDIKYYLDNLSFKMGLIGCFLLLILIIPFLCLLTLTLFIIWPIACILYLILFIFNLLLPILTLVQLWLGKRLVDLNCYPLLYYFNTTDDISGYAEDQGNVKAYLMLTTTNIDYSISQALHRNKLLYFKNALPFISYKKIIALYCHMNRQPYDVDLFKYNMPLTYNKDAIHMMINYLLKNYNIKLFLNQLTYALNDVKPIIYNYYLELLCDVSKTIIN